MEWVISLVEGADIEEVTDDMLEKMILKEEKLSVLFYEENEAESSAVLTALEEIDDDLDELDVLLVKINEATVASDFGIDDRPTLVIFEKGIPNLYLGNLHNADEVLEWIIGKITCSVCLHTNWNYPCSFLLVLVHRDGGGIILHFSG